MLLDIFLKLVQKLTPAPLYHVLADMFRQYRGYLLDDYYYNILSAYTKIIAEKAIDVSSKTILELGGGNSIITGLGFLLLGAKRVVLIDPALKRRNILQFYQQKEIIIENARLDSSIANKYSKSVDLIVSYQVLEHIVDLREVFKMFDIMLTPSGCMYHYVDLTDHTYHSLFTFLKPLGVNLNKAQSKYLQYSDTIFDLINPNIKYYMNRRLLPYYLLLLEGLNYEYSLRSLGYFEGEFHNFHQDVLSKNKNEKHASLLKVKLFDIVAQRRSTSTHFKP